MSKAKALVIDDERDIRELLSITLGRMDLVVETASNVAEAKQRLSESRYALCFTDMRLPDGSGQEIIELIAAQYPETPVAMITAHGNVDAAVTRPRSKTRCVRFRFQAGRHRHAAPPGTDGIAFGRSKTYRRHRARARRACCEVIRPPKLSNSARHHHQARAQPGAGIYQRRIGCRQGTGRTSDPRTRPACRWFVRAGQLRRHSHRVDGKRIFRP